jgi:Tfp pilus assembly protein PilF
MLVGFLTTAAIAVACGGSQVLQGEQSPQPAIRQDPSAVFVIGDHVADDWAGRTWSGAPARLGFPEGEPDGQDCRSVYAEAAETIADPSNLVAQTLPDADHIVVTIRGWTSGADCAAEGDWMVTRVGHGALLLYDGANTRAESPAEVLANGGTIVTMRGWRIEDGEWTPGNGVLGAVLEPASASAAVACVQHDSEAAAERLASELLYQALASPGFSARSRESVTELALFHGGPLPGFLDGSLDELPGDCLTSSVFRVAAMGSGADLAFSAQETSAAEATMRALAAFDEMEWAVASEAIEWALTLEPGYGPGLFLRGRLEEEVNIHLTAAGDAYAAAANDERLEAVAAHRVALISEDLGELDAARDWYTRAADADPEFAAPLNALGFLNFEAGEFARARVQFEEAIGRDPTSAQAANNLGYIAENIDGDPVTAAAWYERSIDADPTSVSAHVNLAAVAVRHLGRVEDGEDLLRSALSLDPGNRDAIESLEALLTRPSALSETMAGTWFGIAPTTNASITATFSVDGSAALVIRLPGEEPVAQRFPGGEPGSHRTQRVFRDDAAAWVVEMVSETVAHLYRPDDPLVRTVLSRRDGGMAIML